MVLPSNTRRLKAKLARQALHLSGVLPGALQRDHKSPKRVKRWCVWSTPKQSNVKCPIDSGWRCWRDFAIGLALNISPLIRAELLPSFALMEERPLVLTGISNLAPDLVHQTQITGPRTFSAWSLCITSTPGTSRLIFCLALILPD